MTGSGTVSLFMFIFPLVQAMMRNRMDINGVLVKQILIARGFGISSNVSSAMAYEVEITRGSEQDTSSRLMR